MEHRRIQNAFVIGFAAMYLALTPPVFATDAPSLESEEIRFVKEWGGLGAGPGQLNIPIAIAIDSTDHIFITDHYNDRIEEFDTDGKFLTQFPADANPGGLAIDKAGNLYVSHFAVGNSDVSKPGVGEYISVFGPDGKKLRQWGKSGNGDGEFSYPGGMAFGDSGRLYVADQTNHRVQVFDEMGKFLFKWGEYGSEPGQFGGKDYKIGRTGGPQFIAIDKEGNVWTTEGANDRIQKFSSEGKYLLSWGNGEDKPGGFGGLFTGFPPERRGRLQGPIALCFDNDQNLWIGAVSGRIQQFAQDGKYLRGIGNEQGTKPGQFYAPHGVAVDSKGFLYVVDTFNSRVQKFAVGK